MGRFEHNKYAFVSIGKLCAGGMFLAPNIPLTLSQSFVTLPGMNQKHIFVVVGIFLLLGASGGVLVWRKKQSAPQPTVPMVQVDGGKQSDIPQSQADAYPQHIEAISGTDEVWYNIPEYGVRMRLNKDFANDLKFGFSHERNPKDNKWDTVYFASEKLYAVDPSCALGSLGVISMFEGGFKKEDVPGATKIVSLPNLDVVFSDVPQDYKNQCYNPAHYKEIGGAGAKSIAEGMETLQLIPSK